MQFWRLKKKFGNNSPEVAKATSKARKAIKTVDRHIKEIFSLENDVTKFRAYVQRCIYQEKWRLIKRTVLSRCRLKVPEIDYWNFWDGADPKLKVMELVEQVTGEVLVMYKDLLFGGKDMTVEIEEYSYKGDLLVLTLFNAAKWTRRNIKIIKTIVEFGQEYSS